jgi:hypothetical protein
MKPRKPKKPKKKYLIAIRVYESVETCLVEYQDKMALELAFAEIKAKCGEVLKSLDKATE